LSDRWNIIFSAAKRLPDSSSRHYVFH
jgi:hypothetical protein